MWVEATLPRLTGGIRGVTRGLILLTGSNVAAITAGWASDKMGTTCVAGLREPFLPVLQLLVPPIRDFEPEVKLLGEEDMGLSCRYIALEPPESMYVACQAPTAGAVGVRRACPLQTHCSSLYIHKYTL